MRSKHDLHFSILFPCSKSPLDPLENIDSILVWMGNQLKIYAFSTDIQRNLSSGWELPTYGHCFVDKVKFPDVKVYTPPARKPFNASFIAATPLNNFRIHKEGIAHTIKFHPVYPFSKKLDSYPGKDKKRDSIVSATVCWRQQHLSNPKRSRLFSNEAEYQNEAQRTFFPVNTCK